MCTRRGIFAFNICQICVSTVLLFCSVLFRYTDNRVCMFGILKYVLIFFLYVTGQHVETQVFPRR